MRHGRKGRKLGRTRTHRQALLRNLMQALFTYERIQTTLPKAKEARSCAERVIRFSRKDTIAARREVAKLVASRELLRKLFEVIGPRFEKRNGGYTRIYRLGPREGDAAEMALLELVDREQTAKEKRIRAKAEKGRGRKKAKKADDEKAGRGKDGRGVARK